MIFGEYSDSATAKRASVSDPAVCPESRKRHHHGDDQGDEQFEISDSRSLDKMYQDIESEGLQPVLNDYLFV